jgi:hypothetical protein
MQQLDPLASADLNFTAALKRFESLTLAEQLPLLAFALREELKWMGLAESPRRTSVQAAPTAISEELSTQHGEAQEAVSQPQQKPRPEPERAAGADLCELAATVGTQLSGKLSISEWSEPPSASRSRSRPAQGPRFTNLPVPSLRGISIAMTMMIGFSLTLGTMLWQRKTAGFTAQSAVVTPIAPVIAPANLPGRASKIVQPVPEIETAQPTAEPTVRGSPPQTAAPEMPVKLFFGPHMVHNDPEQPRKVTFFRDGRIFNSSDEAITIAIIVINERTENTSRLQVTVDPKETKVFGFDDGMELRTNDSITLQSAPYADLVTRVH